MKTAFLVGAACFAALAAGSARADTVDMAKVTCADAAKGGQAAMTNLIFWVDGYISKEENDTKMTDEWMKELGEIVVKGCKETPDQPLLAIVRKAIK